MTTARQQAQQNQPQPPPSKAAQAAAIAGLYAVIEREQQQLTATILGWFLALIASGEIFNAAAVAMFVRNTDQLVNRSSRRVWAAQWISMSKRLKKSGAIRRSAAVPKMPSQVRQGLPSAKLWESAARTYRYYWQANKTSSLGPGGGRVGQMPRTSPRISQRVLAVLPEKEITKALAIRPGVVAPDPDATARASEELARNISDQLTLTANKSAQTRLAQAEREQARDTKKSLRTIVGYRRVVHPENSMSGSVCGLCLAASTRLYTTNELSPMHSNCKCSTDPVYADQDMGELLDADYIRPQLAQLYRDARMASKGKGTGTGSKPLSKTRYKIINTSLGPTLVPARRQYSKLR